MNPATFCTGFVFFTGNTGELSDAIEAIENRSLPALPDRHILEHLRKLPVTTPVPGIMGKSGAGKSSLLQCTVSGEVTRSVHS